MKLISFALLSLTVLLGACLLAGRLYRARLVHGLCGAAGLAALLLAFRAGTLSGPFAADALGLAAAALLGGIYLALRGRGTGLVVLLHGLAGGLAYLLLAGFVL